MALKRFCSVFLNLMSESRYCVLHWVIFCYLFCFLVFVTLYNKYIHFQRWALLLCLIISHSDESKRLLPNLLKTTTYKKYIKAVGGG